jgi:hypothetical protein
MKTIGTVAGEILTKAERHRAWTWCRLKNDFIDLPVWRVVALKANVPLHAVQAFVTRLDSFANAADPRGWVGHFNPEEFAAALGLTVEESAGIFAALSAPGVDWIDQEHVVNFYKRNPDRAEDRDAVNARQQRLRNRRAICKQLAALVRMGRLPAEERDFTEVMLKELPDPVLQALRIRLTNALSTGHGGHNVTLRDIVTITPRADHTLSPLPVDNSGAAASGESAGLPEQQEAPDEQSSTEATRWLEAEGTRLIVELSNEPRPRAAMLIERWGRDLADPVLMVRIIAGAVEAGLTGARLQLVIGEQVRRHLEHKLHGTPLPLMPPRPKQQRQEQPAGAEEGESPKLRRASGE